MDSVDERARERDEEERVADREQTVIEMMHGPRRPSAARRKAVLWIGLAFTAFMFFMTAVVIGGNGLNLLSLMTLAMLAMIAAAMIGALRYKGEDPMEQFDPPEVPAPKLRPRLPRRAKKTGAGQGAVRKVDRERSDSDKPAVYDSELDDPELGDPGPDDAE